MRTLIPSVLGSLLFVFTTPSVAAPPTYEIQDLTAGVGSNGTGMFDLVSGHSVRVDFGGDPGEAVLLLVSVVPPGPNPPLIGGTPLAVDINSMVVLLNGLAISFLQIGPTGTLMLPATIPANLPIGVDLYTQMLLVDTNNFSGRLSPGIVFSMTCGSDGPTFQSKQNTGSASTTGHYASAMAATINDPNPKLIAPGHLFTASEWAKIKLAPLSDPANPTHEYTWSGGDEVGYYRDRLTVDGTTPGIDRIFFVARNTTNTPNFVDWNGMGFANETTLTGVAGSIQRLCVANDGDLIGNDYFGNFYRWDKQNAYAQSSLFTISNTAASVPWGASLDTNLGKIAHEPVNDLVLIPVRNDAVSLSGQLYGFDMTGNRLFVDQDLMGTTPPGVNSYRFGVTVDHSSPTCRVLVHGGRDAGPFFVARFTGALTNKTVQQNAGNDSNGGWIGVLIGDEFWTNTNTNSYGVVRRALPTDW